MTWTSTDHDKNSNIPKFSAFCNFRFDHSWHERTQHEIFIMFSIRLQRFQMLPFKQLSCFLNFHQLVLWSPCHSHVSTSFSIDMLLLIRSYICQKMLWSRSQDLQRWTLCFLLILQICWKPCSSKNCIYQSQKKSMSVAFELIIWKCLTVVAKEIPPLN